MIGRASASGILAFSTRVAVVQTSDRGCPSSWSLPGDGACEADTVGMRRSGECQGARDSKRFGAAITPGNDQG